MIEPVDSHINAEPLTAVLFNRPLSVFLRAVSQGSALTRGLWPRSVTFISAAQIVTRRRNDQLFTPCEPDTDVQIFLFCFFLLKPNYCLHRLLYCVGFSNNK